jgi:hypothetical protein
VESWVVAYAVEFYRLVLAAVRVVDAERRVPDLAATRMSVYLVLFKGIKQQEIPYVKLAAVPVEIGILGIHLVLLDGEVSTEGCTGFECLGICGDRRGG